MKTQQVKSALFGVVPLLCVAGIASASQQQVGAVMTVVPSTGVANGNMIRRCSNDNQFSVYAFEANTDGTDASSFDDCFANDFGAGTTTWAGDPSNHVCNGAAKHRARLLEAGSTACSGFNPGGFPSSVCWNTNWSTGDCSTSCKISNVTIEVSTNNGSTWGSCLSGNRDINAGSAGQTI